MKNNSSTTKFQGSVFSSTSSPVLSSFFEEELSSLGLTFKSLVLSETLLVILSVAGCTSPVLSATDNFSRSSVMLLLLESGTSDWHNSNLVLKVVATIQRNYNKIYKINI